jgi:hypothetical protein
MPEPSPVRGAQSIGTLLLKSQSRRSAWNYDGRAGLARRRVAGRTPAWITGHRRTVRDYEQLPAHHETYVYWPVIIVMTRRLARQPSAACDPGRWHTVRR